jgi:cobalt/nickel transport system permease protein
VSYPLVYRRIAGRDPSPGRITAACVAAAALSLQLGPFSVVLQTLFSGISELPLRTFVLFMQPVHLAIGVVEGLVTAAVVNFVRNAQPEILQRAAEARAPGRPASRASPMRCAARAVPMPDFLNDFLTAIRLS